MGNKTEFEGIIEIDPPLSRRELQYLRNFVRTRRMEREEGPYFTEGTGFLGEGDDPGIKSYNSPPEGQPGLWCRWVPAASGAALVWDGEPEFEGAAEWMSYLRSHFLGGAEGFGGKPAAAALDPENMGWLPGGRRMSGTIFAGGEWFWDVWKIDVRDEGVFVSKAVGVKPPAVPSKDEGWEIWNAAFRERMALAAKGEYEWGPERRIPDFASEDLAAAARSAMEKERLEKSEEVRSAVAGKSSRKGPL